MICPFRGTPCGYECPPERVCDPQGYTCEVCGRVTPGGAWCLCELRCQSTHTYPGMTLDYVAHCELSTAHAYPHKQTMPITGLEVYW